MTDTPEKQVNNRNPNGTFKKGFSGNPEGKLVGTKDYATLCKEAIISIASSRNEDPEKVEQDLIKTGLINGIKGNFSFYKDVMDRVHGKAQEKIDLTTQGEQITAINYIIPNGDKSNTDN